MTPWIYIIYAVLVTVGALIAFIKVVGKGADLELAVMWTMIFLHTVGGSIILHYFPTFSCLM